MRVLIAMDSFKGSLTSLQAGNAAKEGILRADGNPQVLVRPLADGGEGTVEALCLGMGGTMMTATVTGPLGTPVTAGYCILPDGETAVLEMAAAAGITLVPPEERNPLRTTSRGVGELIRDAIDKGCRRFIIGIGGSATNDGGTGMLAALGFSFLDANGQPIPPGAVGLAKLHSLSADGALPQLKECTFRIACDVENPLCGPKGCSAVFAPQKGATPETIPLMDGWLSRYADLAAAQFPKGDKNCPGAGAAGGLGFAFLTFLNASLESGIRIILEETRLEEDIRNADLVITGEGRLDGQTLMGKAPIGVAALAKKHGKKVVALAGCVTGDAHLCNGHGIDAFFPILPGPATVAEAMEPSTAARNLSNTACQVFRLLSLC